MQPWIRVGVELFTRPFLRCPLSPRPYRKGLGTKLPSEDNLLHSDIALQEDEATDDPFQGLEDEEDPFTNLEESEDGEDHGEEDCEED